MARTLISPRLLPLAAVAAALVISTSATASPSTCTIRGSDRSETLTGTAGRDVICGKGGNDRLRGLGGNDVLLGGDGHDVLEGGSGNDSVQGEKGHDLADGGAGDDSVAGGDHDDLLSGSGGKDTLEGGGGADVFLGGADDDTVKALDGKRDLLISCGSGKDGLSADAKDPKARDCEGGTTPPPPPAADLSVALTDSVDPVVEGDPVDYRFRVDNAGPNAATDVTVAITVPADATVAPASGCSQAGSVVTCAVGDVASGASAAGVLTVRHGSPGAKSVTSVVDSPVADPNAANDSATESTTVEPEPAPAGADLSVSVSAPATASSLTNVNYATTVTNAGPLAANGVSLVFDIDESWAAINRPAGCTQSMFPTTRVTCALGTLAAGDSVNRVLGVSWSEAGDQTVAATVSGASPVDPAAANNSETETTSVSD
jgi:uncharacterized repeat protein (TIGR01451 family)